MTHSSPIVAEISEYLEKLPMEQQLAILNQLKRVCKSLRKTASADMLKLTAQINRSAFKKVKSRYI